MRGYKVVLTAVVVLGMMTGCTPAPEETPIAVPTKGATSAPTESATPTPSPTPTLSHADQAVAAYREYVDAGNEIVVADPATWDRVLAAMTGKFRDVGAERLTKASEAGEQWLGDQMITSIRVESETADEVVLVSCLDVSQTDLLDSSGTSKVPADRNPQQILHVFVTPDADGGADLKVANIKFAEAGVAC